MPSLHHSVQLSNVCCLRQTRFCAYCQSKRGTKCRFVKEWILIWLDATKCSANQPGRGEKRTNLACISHPTHLGSPKRFHFNSTALAASLSEQSCWNGPTQRENTFASTRNAMQCPNEDARENERVNAVEERSTWPKKWEQVNKPPPCGSLSSFVRPSCPSYLPLFLANSFNTIITRLYAPTYICTERGVDLKNKTKRLLC